MAFNSYTKLFSSILASTIWREPNHVRLVWITMLALADKDGVCEASIPGLADLARVPLPQCEDALKRLAAPDPYSRTSDHDGRRIEPIDGGWILLNHAKYREKMNAEERREYLRLKKAESRARQQLSTTVNKGQPASTPSTQAEAEAESKAYTDTDIKAEEQKKSAASAPLITSPAEYERKKVHCSFVGSRLEVPHVLHAELRKNLGGVDPDSALQSWYLAVDEEIEASLEPITPDVFKWLKARFTKWVAASARAVSDAGLTARLHAIERGEIKR